MNAPTFDGQVMTFQEAQPARCAARIYFVNGVRTDGATHARTARLISTLTEHVVHGVYNATNGTVVDFLQCLKDWADSVSAKLLEKFNGHVNQQAGELWNSLRRSAGLPTSDPVNVAAAIRKRIPQPVRVAVLEWYLSRVNRATASLFRQLWTHRAQRQFIVAHSQGNLITANALWSMVIAFGEASLSNMEVFSLASPTPAWPMGIRGRRKVYGHTNDPITLFDPHNLTWITSRIANGKFGRTAGDWRHCDTKWHQILEPHDVNRHLEMNFARTIRRLLGLSQTAS
jgi:hypothetical protein